MIIRLLIFGFMFLSVSTYAQKDLILTQAGQEIRCKILEESSMRFSYAYINEKGAVIKTEIFKTLISSYKYNYYPADLLPNEKLFNQPFKSIVADSNSKKAKNQRTKSEKISNSKEEGTLTVVEPQKELSKQNDSGGIAKNTPEKKDNILKGELEGASVLTENKASVKEDLAKTPVDHTAVSAKETAKRIDGQLKLDLPDDSKSADHVDIIKKSEFRNFLKYRVGLKGGLGNVMEENTNKTKYGLFKERLLRGWVYGLDASVFLNDNLGVGVVYNSYHASSKETKLDFFTNKEEAPQTYDEVFMKVNHRFVGPSLLYRVPLDYKTFIVASASPGYIFYSEQGTLEALGYNESYKYKGNAWGGSASLGIDFLIGDDIYGRDVILSFECGYNYGKINKLNYGGTTGVQTLASPINLQRLDFSIGLRFNRFPRYLR